MSGLGDDPEPRARLQREGGRVVDRLRSMPVSRFTADPELGRAARATAQRLADAASALEGGPAHVVPDIGDHAVGDQMAVMVADLLAAEPGDDVLVDAAEDLATLRRALP